VRSTRLQLMTDEPFTSKRLERKPDLPCLALRAQA
jgi:hypothetical protein